MRRPFGVGLAIVVLAAIIIVPAIWILSEIGEGRRLRRLRLGACSPDPRIRMHCLSKLEAKLKAGMTKGEVLSVLPPPNNYDSENVWVYEQSCESRRSWRESWITSLYLVFLNDRLVVGELLKPVGSPWEVLRWNCGLTAKERNEILGSEGLTKGLTPTTGESLGQE